MKLHHLNDIKRKEMPIQYRRTYTASALIGSGDGDDFKETIEFTLEHGPTGKIDISVRFTGENHFDNTVILEEIKDYVENLEKNRRLS
jgi:hypothetical protein